jgi:hypothetical protein
MRFLVSRDGVGRCSYSFVYSYVSLSPVHVLDCCGAVFFRAQYPIALSGSQLLALTGKVLQCVWPWGPYVSFGLDGIVFGRLGKVMSRVCGVVLFASDVPH